MAGWWRVKQGDVFSKEDVVSRCRNYINSTRFNGNVAEKLQKIGMIERKSASRLQFKPIGKGWGQSPLNHKCWLPDESAARDPAGKRRTKKDEVVDRIVERSKGTPMGALTEEILRGKPRSEPSSDLPPRNYSEQPQINARPWGASYRAAVIDLWKKCPITGCGNKKLLTASHILPVNQCNTEQEMRDPYNGIALSPTFDKLFDSGYISFESDGNIMLSSNLSDMDRNALGLHMNIRIDLPNETKRYMQYHRERVFKK